MKNHTEYIALKIRKTVGYNCKTKTLCPSTYAIEYSSIFNLSLYCGLSVCKSHITKYHCYSKRALRLIYFAYMYEYTIPLPVKLHFYLNPFCIVKIYLN